MYKRQDLKRASELSDRDLNAARGWLARENKIDFECSNGDDCLFLSVNVYTVSYTHLVSFAKGFARSLNIPMIDVNHLQAHVLAHFIKEMCIRDRYCSS